MAAGTVSVIMPATTARLSLLQNDASLGAHLGNPAIADYMAASAAILDGGMDVVVYGEISAETRAMCETLPMSVKYETRVAGFTGMFAPRVLGLS